MRSYYGQYIAYKQYQSHITSDQNHFESSRNGLAELRTISPTVGKHRISGFLYYDSTLESCMEPLIQSLAIPSSQWPRSLLERSSARLGYFHFASIGFRQADRTSVTNSDNIVNPRFEAGIDVAFIAEVGFQGHTVSV